jgi:pimeloyl-ACP methyl ester carboxylesterase
MSIGRQTLSTEGIELTCLEVGDGPLALCLHGFPDSPHTWRHLLPALADAGYRAVAPYLRGYAPSGVAPDGVYQLGAVAADANAIHEALGGGGDAAIIGHDWGAMAAYGAAGHAPDRWRRVVTMAVPPASAMGLSFLAYDQLKRSWYTFFFQSPLAEMVVAQDDLAFLDRIWADWSPGYDASDDLPAVKDALRDPANLTAALGYYRATLGDGPRSPAYDGEQAASGNLPPQPTLYLHGVQDGCMGIDVARAAAPAFGGSGHRYVEVDGAGHFLHLEQPDAVNAEILTFLAS